MDFLYLLAGSLLFAAGCYAGWWARDKAGIARNEQPVALVEPPVPDPIDLQAWRPADADPDEGDAS